MERYLSLSQQFQNNVARNIEDYLASGDALRLSDANSALDSLKSQLGPLPPALADTLRPSLENLSTYSNTELLADHLQLAGRLVLDEGAAHAVVHKGTSLLPIGVVAVEGEFLRGEALACVDPQGHEVARGLVNYSSDETRLIMRHATREIESILGYMGEPELIHRDNMVSV